MAYLEDFGQRVDLTRRIREVLVNYPEGTTVLRELIQNADDAGAKTVRLCLDRRRHPTGSLLSPSLSQWQGPALLAYNDAVFTEDDFVSISRIGDSKKQDQAWKTGRFGVGFNSVYHLTDLPSFVSGKHVVLFDPQGAYLPNVSALNPGKRLDFVSSDALSLYRDQFMPYCAFGCDMKKPFFGTLFRFPLRNVEQASASKLSRQSYSEDDISSLFKDLQMEAIFTLLFLKSILSVEVYEWGGAGAEVPMKIFSCCINSSDEKIICYRSALARSSCSADSSNWNADSFFLDFLSESVHGSSVEKRNDGFFVVQGIAPKSSKIDTFAKVASEEYGLNLLPWASVAACVSENLAEDNILKQGHAFCFLPLPIRTGFSVHVNGYFEVSSNRRSIWYGNDMDRGGKLRSEWNKLLLAEVVAPLFNDLLLGIRRFTGPSRLYYSLFPCGSFEEPWNLLVEQIYNIIYFSPVFYSESGGGKWILPSESYVHDLEFMKRVDLRQALILLDMPVVCLHEILLDMFFRFPLCLRPQLVNPKTVRQFLRECRGLLTLDRSFKIVLLEYCLSDLNEGVKQIFGLPMLPLANGDFGFLSDDLEGFNYFICNEIECTLLATVLDKIIDRNIPPSLYSHLSEIANHHVANIAILDGRNFLQFFPYILPVEWKNKSSVSWNSEYGETCPNISWFMLFWQYIRDKGFDLSIFSEWPILPSTSGHLYRISESLKLLNSEPLSDTMNKILSKIGCRILNPYYCVNYPQLDLYIHDGDAVGVANSIFDSMDVSQLWSVFQSLSFDERNELRQFLLNPKWYYEGSISNHHIVMLKKLPIYRVHAGNDTSASVFCDLEYQLKYLPPLGVHNCLLGHDFIYCASHSEEEIFLNYFGIKRMQKTSFYMTVFERLSDLHAEVRDMVMLSILHDLPQLSLEDSSFKESLKNLKFVPTTSESLECPNSLYDPRIEELYAILENSNCFPCGLFEEPGVLDMLLLLGLRTAVSMDTVIESACQIESLIHKDQLKAYSRGKVLFSYLEVNASKWMRNRPDVGQSRVSSIFSKISNSHKLPTSPSEANIDMFWNNLRMICWCPVMIAAPNPALPWPSVSSMVAPPKLVRLQSDIWLVSASLRILDCECSSRPLSASLGWSSPPSGSILAAQLLELGRNNEIITDVSLRRELAIEMPKVYLALANLIGSDDMDIVKAVLEGCRWIWVGDGFAKASEVVINGQLHLAPFIRVIPIDLAVFKDLFLELGVKEYLVPIDYVNIFSRMAIRKGQGSLDAEELRTVLLIVQHLADLKFQNLQTPIYLPDDCGRLIPAVELVFNDAPWLSDFSENSVGDASNVVLNSKRFAHKFVHSSISNDIAEKLGVRSLRQLLLAESSDSMKFTLSGVAEAFGQHEALTTRLKNIIEMYADGPGILFELVQNAEDARASHVAFLLDRTHYGTSSILSPEMAGWQGPALYCFNDSIFSHHDLYAISRIGQDAKLEKPFAIGRFGLGFNCVYHLTDIPSFVSGENIVIFDPHTGYLPGVSPSHPGLRIRFVGRNILEQFPDQFTPFLHFNCDLKQPFQGTLFRFPLRTEETASRSRIKKEKYLPEDVDTLFSSFSEVVSEALLFLHHVKTISIFIKDGADNDMQLIHQVSRHNLEGSGKEQHLLHSMFELIPGKNQQNVEDPDQFLSKLNKTADKDLPWYCQKVAVVEHGKSGYMSHFWMMSECIGGGRAKLKCISLGKKSQNFIPWASVAAYLHSVNLNEISNEEELLGKLLVEFLPSVETRSYSKKFNGRAFCFLPLPISTGLPIHVNAYFELSSNRRDIWLGNDMTGGARIRSEWNSFLLEDAISPAYGRLLACLAKEIGPCDLFFSLWPTTVQQEPWAGMVQNVYRAIIELELALLYTKSRGGKFLSTKQALFPDFNFPKSAELVEALCECDLPIIKISKLVADNFSQVCSSLHFMNPRLLRALLSRRKRESVSRDMAMVILEYCLTDIRGAEDSQNLLGLPLLPLLNGNFTIFSKSGEGEMIFVVRGRECDLLKDHLPHLLLDYFIPEEVFKKLGDVAACGMLNLSILTSRSLVHLFPRILPAEWLEAKQVNWVPGTPAQPSLEWMSLFWSYLKSSCTDLSIFSKWPILPVSNGCLLQLVENSNVIRNDGWTESLSLLLQKLGCYFLKSDLQIDHPQLKNFVHDATAISVLKAIKSASCLFSDVTQLFTQASPSEMRELRNFIFQSRWFSGGQMDSQLIDSIKNVPMFECYTSNVLVSLVNPTKFLKPNYVCDGLLNDSFIRTETEKERNILVTYLGILEPSKIQFYKEFVLCNMPRFCLDESLLSQIMHDVKNLIEEDFSMKGAISEIPFVLATNGSWQRPSRLYDPRVSGLRCILQEDDFFPSEQFSRPATLDLLVSVGLKRTLDFTGLLDGARSVSEMRNRGDIIALQYSRNLLGYLNSLGHVLSKNNDFLKKPEDRKLALGSSIGSDERDSLFEIDASYIVHKCPHCECEQDLFSFPSNLIHDMPEDDFWLHIKSIAWCPVSVTSPIKGFPWLASDIQIESPCLTRPRDQMWVVSSKMRILDGECCSIYLQEKLGWTMTPEISILVAQLVELSKFFDQFKLQHEQKDLADSSFSKEILSIYSHLQKFVGTSDFITMKKAFDDVQWIWTGDNLVSCEALAFDSPVKYPPYLYVVPSELSEYRQLLLEAGVKLNFDVGAYLHVLQCLQQDLNGGPLSDEQLSFVQCVLEAISDACVESQISCSTLKSLLVPDSSGFLRHPVNLVFDDAPWLQKGRPADKHVIHPSINIGLAERLGIQSLLSSSLVDEELVIDLPCMDYSRICELIPLYGDGEHLLFDIIEMADCCSAKKLHFIYDKREHPRQSLLQNNLGDFQGSALTIVIEGVLLSREEVCSLHTEPPWKLRGNVLDYGLGLLSSYFLCDILYVVSSGYLYIFDPFGLSLPASSSGKPSAKSFSLIDTNLVEKFSDQFEPLFVSKDISNHLPLSSSDCTIIRMPLSLRCMAELEKGSGRVDRIFYQFMHYSSSTLLNLKSILQVSLLTWEAGHLQPNIEFSISIPPSVSALRNPFSEKKWRKFQLSKIFSNSSSAIKMHVIDIHIIQCGIRMVDKWLLVLCLGSGQTRNMALDRRYLAYNLTPVAGVAAHLSRDGLPVDEHVRSSILSPLPLSGSTSLPITALGRFLVHHIGGRYLYNQPFNNDFPSQLTHSRNYLAQAWNKELLLCVRDSYIEMVLEFQKLRKDPLISVLEPNNARAVSFILRSYGEKIYTFWPRSRLLSLNPFNPSEETSCDLGAKKANEAVWELLVEQVVRPFYIRLVDLPVWQLYSGNVVKANEGMFLFRGESKDYDLPPIEVFNFIKEHYPVFSVPWELVNEVKSVGAKIREIKPRMVRNLLKKSTSVVLRSVEAYVDVLDYCLSDIRIYQPSASSSVRLPLNSNSPTAPEISSNSEISRSPFDQRMISSGNDTIEVVSNFGKALYDFGRGVVEDIGRVGGPFVANENASAYNGVSGDLTSSSSYIASEVRGLPFPTAAGNLARLGITELWVGSKEQQFLMYPLADNFVHSCCLEKTLITELLFDQTLSTLINLKPFSPHLLASQMRFLFQLGWSRHVMENKNPWIAWSNEAEFRYNGPRPEWIRMFWKVYGASKGELSLVSEWPLVPVILNQPMLCRVKYSHLVFLPPVHDAALNLNTGASGILNATEDSNTESNLLKLYLGAFESTKSRYPWLPDVLNEFNVPVFDMSFPEVCAYSDLFPVLSYSLGKSVLSKFVASKQAGYFSTSARLSNENRDRLFNLFAWDFRASSQCVYSRDELDILRELPLYKTVLGTYTRLHGQDQFIVSQAAFFHPQDDGCLSNLVEDLPFFHALGVHELNDREVLVKFGLPGFETKNSEEQERILHYLYANWKDLQVDSTITNCLKDTSFVRSANVACNQLFKPKDLLDPHDSVLTSLFFTDLEKFPGEQFTADRWLHILRKIGLQTSSQAEVIIECARKIEMLGKKKTVNANDLDKFQFDSSDCHDEVSLEIWSIAESVLNSLFTNFATIYDSGFCEILSKIAFIPAEIGFPSIGGKKGGKRVLVSYREAILSKDWPLAWSSAARIANRNVIPPEYSWGVFHLRSPPSFPKVLTHLQIVGQNCGEDTLAHWPVSSDIMTVEEACSEILNYLDKVWGILSSSEILELQKVAFVPVANGTRLVTVQSLFARLPVKLSPFAFELPSLYLPFTKILKELGLRDSLSVPYAIDLLSTIQQSCGYQRLNPNELRAVLEILKFISSTNQESFEDSDFVSEPVVPDDGCRLVSARSCVYVDHSGSQYINHIDVSMLRFAHPELPKNLCTKLGIKKLSDVVVEELNVAEQLETIDHIGPVHLRHIKVKLESKTLHEAICDLLDGTNQNSEDLPLYQIHDSLCHMAQRIEFVQLLHTRFVLLPKGQDITRIRKDSALPEWQCDKKHRTAYFVDKSKSQFLVSCPPSYVSIYDIIGIVVSQALGVSTLLPLGLLFSCPIGSEKLLLSTLHLCLDPGTKNYDGNSDDVLVGKDVLPQDASRVQFLPLRPFYSGEIVAWKSGKDGEKLRYGRVSDNARPTAGQALYRLPVETAKGENQILLSSQVFSFRSVSLENMANASSHVRNVVMPGEPSQSAKIGVVELKKKSEEPQYGRIAPSEFIHAVQEMLSCAGLAMDGDRRDLLQKTLTVQEQLKESQVALLVEQERADSAAKEADAAKAAWLCRICLATEVNVTIVPCGHVLCNRCSSAVSRCPFCRNSVSRTMKIFRP